MGAGILNTCSICGKQFRRLWQDDICPTCSYSMEPQKIDLKKMREQLSRRKASAERKRKLVIENLSRERFCEVLDSLPPTFRFKMKNIREDFGLNGYWEKIILDGQTMWHKDGRYLPNSSLFAFKEEVFDAIEREGRRPLSKIYRKENSMRTIRKKGEVASALTKEKLKELYIAQSKSLEDIAKEYGCSRQTIMKMMNQYGFIRRSRSEARYLAMDAGKFPKLMQYEINENFFSAWSPKMAWILGLLLTDGHIHGNNVTLASVDIDLLEKVKSTLSLSKPIITSKQSYDKSKLIYHLAFSSKRLRDDLNKLGFIEKKSLILTFPDIPKEYIRHFIRGCWDGDGSIFFDKNRLVASYVSGSKKFIERLVEELYKIGISKGVSYRYEKSGKRVLMPIKEEMWPKYPDGRLPLTIHMKNINAYYIKIATRENVEKLFHYFYDGVDESMFLSRKYNTFVKGLKLGERETEQLTLRGVSQLF